MGRAARLKRLKLHLTPEKKPAPAVTNANGPQIQLVNPVSDHFESFIVGNAAMCRNPVFHEPDIQCTEACAPMVEAGSCVGQSVVICGAGPTLNDHAAEYCPTADQVWGCNSALTWLLSQGHRVTHGFSIDQTTHMVAEWASAPDVDYYIASTVHPHLIQLLVSQNRLTRIFHNFVGIRKPPVLVEDGMVCEYEDFLYMTLFPPSVRCGSGLNSVTRAIDLAQYMGFERITVLGADCSLRFRGPLPKEFFGPESRLPSTATADERRRAHQKYLEWLRTNTEMHVDGGNALASQATAVCLGGEIDGREWLTKPDMAISAQWLTRMARGSNGQVRLVGDTLPNAVIGKDETFLDRLPALVDSNGNTMQFPV